MKLTTNRTQYLLAHADDESNAPFFGEYINAALVMLTDDFIDGIKAGKEFLTNDVVFLKLYDTSEEVLNNWVSSEDGYTFLDCKEEEIDLLIGECGIKRFGHSIFVNPGNHVEIVSNDEEENCFLYISTCAILTSAIV